MRSRTAWAMVLPVTIRMVKKTAPRIAMTIAPMSPIWLAKAWTKARSVEVLVSAGELANSASIASATSAARAGSATRMTYQPTRPSPRARASWR